MDVKKIYEDSDFSSAVVPEGTILTFNALVDGQVVTRYKDSSGNFNILQGLNNQSLQINPAYTVSSRTGNSITVQPVQITSEGQYISNKGDTIMAICDFDIPKEEVAIPTDGLVFYAPLAEDKATAETGQTLNYTGNFQFNIVSGIPCAVFSGEEKISVDSSNCFSGDFSIICWFRLTTPMAEGVVNAAVFVFGTPENWFTIRANASGIFMNLGGQSNTKQISIDTSSFNNITVTYSSTKLSIYINGLLDSQVDLSSLPDHDVFLLGDSGYSDWFTGEIAAFRIYSKVLNTSEISALASEFTPTQE